MSSVLNDIRIIYTVKGF